MGAVVASFPKISLSRKSAFYSFSTMRISRILQHYNKVLRSSCILKLSTSRKCSFI